uniref:Uncharacterized protein n=1 Tax=Knipowitschia caucasica TaxID=637954 RepID=A0AAV2K7W4_KNICA
MAEVGIVVGRVTASWENTVLERPLYSPPTGLALSGTGEIMVLSKTASSQNRVSAGIVVIVPGHTPPLRWITGLRTRPPPPGQQSLISPPSATG